MTEIEGRLDGPVPVKFGGKVIGEARLVPDAHGILAQVTLDGTPAGEQAADAVRQDAAGLAFTFIPCQAAHAHHPGDGTWLPGEARCRDCREPIHYNRKAGRWLTA